MTGLMPPGPLAYEGIVATAFIAKPFPPTPAFINFNVGTLWLDTVGEEAYILVAKALGVASWAPIGGFPGELDTLTGNDSVVVTPIGHNINIVGSGSANVTGNALTATLTIHVPDSGLTWNEVSASVTNMVSDNGYLCVSPGGALTLGLPATSAQGDVIAVRLSGATSWRITQAAGQQIFVGSLNSTSGAGGSVSSTTQGNFIQLVCRTANLAWDCIGIIGNLTIV